MSTVPRTRGGDPVSLVKVRQIVDGVELYNIDRASGKLIINGEDYRSEVDELL